jgi:hypothetical protein
VCGGGREFGGEGKIVTHTGKMAQSALRGYRASRQAVDLAGVHGTGSLVDAPAGNDAVACYLGQRYQDESTLEQARVWQRQVRFIQCEVIIGENVDVGGTRPVALLVRTVPPESDLYLLGACEQLMRSERRFNHDREVDEMRLIFEPPRWCPVVGRAGYQTHLVSVTEQSDGAIENCAAVSDVATKRQ